MKNSFISNFEPAKKYQVKKRYVLIFLALLLASLLFCESLNRYFVIHKSKHYSTLADFQKEKGKVEILLLGDSHFRRGIDPSKFQRSTFNFSFLNSSYIASFYILKYYIDEMPNLNTIVLPLELHSFSSYRNLDGTDSIFWNQFVDYSELSTLSNGKIRKKLFSLTLLSEEFGRAHFLNNIKDEINKWMRKKDSLMGSLEQKSLGEESSDFEGMDEKAMEKVKQQFDDAEPFDKTLFLYFQKILTLCRQKNIRLITVQMPMSAPYLKYAETHLSKADLYARTLQNAKINDLFINLDYLDLYRDKLEYFSWAWRDGDHLNKTGREKFSELIAEKIEEK